MPRTAMSDAPALQTGNPWPSGHMATPLFSQCRLRRRQAGDRHAEGRATHVVQADLVAEAYGVRVAAVLAADADLQVLPCRPAFLHADLHEGAHTGGVDGLERIFWNQVIFQVVPDEAA